MGTLQFFSISCRRGLRSDLELGDMATQGATPGSQSEESSALDLPPVDDIRDYVLQRPHQEAHSEAFSSVEALSLPGSSDVDSVAPL
ncbi:shieldin complex subunit 1-like [Ailuropoda melanoleuca]|uniref:shieldin complex subunit 1-like n=1 Tax=Ailuropoda melanoleuca TaxID=9646 RepID=UPI001494927F|nr:shieldin complex subunit 1-like [Ailuropoda melanoleuca]